MRKISKNFLEMLLDRCNDIEFKLQNTEEYKEIMRQLELKRAQIVAEQDPSKRDEMFDDYDEIFMERYILVLPAILEMVATKDYMYEQDFEL